jgi:4-hydroxybenzoate polyprenyltransferase
MSISGNSTTSRSIAWLQLMRLPNVFTAMADVAMGFWFTHESLSPLGQLVLLLISSSCLYTCGMILNDVYDLEQDRRERPNFPS